MFYKETATSDVVVGTLKFEKEWHSVFRIDKGRSDTGLPKIDLVK